MLLSRLLKLLVVMLAAAMCGQARYLPTRADDTNVRVIKQMLTEMLNQSERPAYPARLDQLRKDLLFSPSSGFD